MSVDFSLSPEQESARDDARAFAQSVLTPVRSTIAGIDEADRRFYALRPFYQEMVQAGFLKGLIPPSAGGTYTGLLDQVIGGEEVAAVDINVPCTIFSAGLGLQPLLQFGTEEQHRRLLGPFLDMTQDPLAAFAFTEVGGGANFDDPAPTAGIQTTARLEGDEWVINGSKQFTTNGTGWDGKGADLFTVVCRTDPAAPPRESLAVIAVAGRPEGVRIDGWLDTMGHRAALSPRVHFENVRVPAGDIIGAPGDGLKILARTFAWSAPMVGSGSVGLMRAAFDCALAFAKGEHRLGSRPVIQHQNVGYMLADIKARLEAARYLTWKAAHYYDTTGGVGQELPVIAKVFCSETAVQVVYDAMRLVGIQSYVNDHPLAGLVQDALALPLYDGGNMGVRRRSLHELIAADGYDPLAAVDGRPSRAEEAAAAAKPADTA
jgi:alkylation response protein AidB-like acyl-CoA dehydrogenase